MTGRHADVIQAGYIASEIAHRMVVPGGEVRGEGESEERERRGEIREEKGGRESKGVVTITLGRCLEKYCTREWMVQCVCV